MYHKTSTWTDERIELLKKLWADGLSASQIAGELGGVTRNSVIGKIHRLGLSGRQPSRDGAGRKRIGGAPRQRRAQMVDFAKINLLRAVAQADGPEPGKRPGGKVAAPTVKAPSITPEEIAQAFPRRCGLLELEPGQCRWPVGDLFCGNTIAHGSYCADHAIVGSTGIPDRRKKLGQPERRSSVFPA